MLLDKEAIKGYLPHRAPFLFLDTIESAVYSDTAPAGDDKNIVGGKIIATLNVTEEVEVLRGHFPGNPILPGVVQVEAMAQASCMLLANYKKDITHKNLRVALVSVDRAKFRKPVTPGMNLRIEAICTKLRGRMCAFDCEVYAGEEMVSSASILATYEKAEG